MAKSFLTSPALVEQQLLRRYRHHHKSWLTGEGQWPMELTLGMPTEKQAAENLQAVMQWSKTWRQWQGEGDVIWVSRKWSGLGTQTIPKKLILNNPGQVVKWISEEGRWLLVKQRYSAVVSRWPSLTGFLTRYFKALADYPEAEFSRLVATLEWFDNHPQTDIYIRQLPIPGLDSKWLCGHKAIITELLKVIRQSDESDFYQLTGVRRDPGMIRFRILDKQLQTGFGGLTDICAPANEISNLKLDLERVFIVENLQTCLAFGNLPQSLVFMGKGYAVEQLKSISWLNNVPCYYWGDLDTHGFAILNQLRHFLPEVKSVLMDESTLLAHRSLWVEEATQINGTDLSLLTDEERGVFSRLCDHYWGPRVRLEQERISWDYAWGLIKQMQ